MKQVNYLDEDYNSALDAAAKAVTVGTNSVFVVTDMQSAHFSGSDQQSIDVALAFGFGALGLADGFGYGQQRHTHHQQEQHHQGGHQVGEGNPERFLRFILRAIFAYSA